MTRRRNHVPADDSIRGLPNLASAHKQGLAGFEAPTWFAVFLPRGASEPINRKLNQVELSTVDTPSVQERLNVLAAPIHQELISAVDLR
jgi:tripartite-type tricarboxylate transporter receptor subunit TctC